MKEFINKILNHKNEVESKVNHISIPNIEYGLYLDKMIKEKDLYAIPNLFYLTLLKENMIKNEFVREVTKLINDLSNRECTKLANIFRERSSLDWSIDWSSIEINDLIEDNMTEEEKISIVKLASLHPNGYLREKALDILKKYNDRQSFAFLILRCNDWVEIIRYKAYYELKERINKKNIENIILNINIIDRLKENLNSLEKYYEYSYGNINIKEYSAMLDEIFFEIEKIFNSKDEEVVNALKKCTLSRDRYVLEYSLKKMIDLNIMSHDEMIDKIIRIRDKHLAFKITKYLLNSMDSNDIINNQKKLEQINSSRAKVIIIEKFYNSGVYKECKELECEALSKYASVRDLARFYLRKMGFSKLDEFYYSKLKYDKYRKYALLGLCEISNGDNIDIILENAKSLNSKTQKKILKRLMELCSDNEYDDYSFFIESLKSKSNSVVKLCREYISKNYTYFNHDNIYDVYAEENDEFVKENCAIILTLEKSWNGLIYILEFIGDDNENIVSIAKKSLEDWINSKKSYLVYNSKDKLYSHYLLTKINEEEKVSISELFIKNKELIDEDKRKIVEGLILNYSS